MGNYNRKGEYEYSDGRKEIGHWVEGKKQGEFEWYDYKKRLTHIKVYKDDKEIKSEEVKEKIYYERNERNLWGDEDQIFQVKNQTVIVNDQIVRIKEPTIPVSRKSSCCLIF